MYQVTNRTRCAALNMIFPTETDWIGRLRAISMRVGIAVVLGFASAGCSQAPPSDISFVHPPTIQVDGGQWTKVEWSDEIDAKVAYHFRKSPELFEDPSLSGDAVCYANGAKQRVYWLSPVDDACHWTMVEFKGTRGGELVEGVGAPFVEPLVTEP